MRERGHSILPSAAIVPREDATTLFTGSGMQPLVPYLLGKEHQEGVRLADSQKCFRANDIEEIGDNRHTTFFEMLGNWSLGDYFKEEQIKQCFTFLTDKDAGLGLDPSRLFVTVFSGDERLGIPKDELSAQVWRGLFESAGVSAGIAHIGSQEDGDRRGMKDGERIFYYDGGKNWWSRAGEPANMPVGEPGGPDTEVFYDFGEEHADSAYAALAAHPNTDSGRFIEICNSVFMEYLKTEDGYHPLPKKNVDFGGGLERMAAATEHKPDIFQIDVFQPIIQTLEAASDTVYAARPEPFRIIADHLRAALFIIADGITPANTDRGYVLRRLIRTAMYNLRFALNISETPLEQLVSHFITVYHQQYPEVGECDAEVVIADEEGRFTKTLEKGMQVFTEMAEKGDISGSDVFFLQSTYGFPKELTMTLAKERNIQISDKEYEKAMREHKDASRQGSEKKFKGGLADTDAMSVKYHTATHLLHQALRDVLGDGVHQKGSNITPERLRFDFSYGEKMTDDQKKRVEDIVNQKIQEGLPVTHKDMSVEEARKLGAIGLFDYADTVRVYFVGDYSTEFCGGPHVENTADLGTFQIVREESVAAGIRRIKAVLT